MSSDYNYKLARELENIIDRERLWVVLQTISQICGDKSDHILETWSDERTALAWHNMDGVIDRAATSAKRYEM